MKFNGMKSIGEQVKAASRRQFEMEQELKKAAIDEYSNEKEGKGEDE